MAAIKKLSDIGDKWTRVTPGRTTDYKLGIQNPKRPWAENAAAGKENWKAGVDAAHANDLYAKGVTDAGDKKWQDRSLKKGPGRFSEGVYLAGPDFEKGYAPYHDAISRVDLGPKFPRRDPRNLDRVKRVVDAEVAVKVGT